MRGSDTVAGSLFSYVDLEKRVRADHPLRAIRTVVNAALVSMSPEFDGLYAPLGRESIPAEAPAAGVAVAGALFDSLRAPDRLADRV